mgnify:FL=1
MALFEKGNKMGHRFTSDNQPKRKGRGKFSVLSYIRQTTGKKVDPQSSKEEILKVIQHIYESSPAELEPLMKDPNDPTKPNANTPMWVLNVIVAINTDMRYGRTSTIEMLFDRVFGKATQPIEADVNAQVTNTVDLSVLTTEELLQYNALLEKITAGKNGKE